jgi:hypothetical protein
MVVILNVCDCDDPVTVHIRLGRRVHLVVTEESIQTETVIIIIIIIIENDFQIHCYLVTLFCFCF